MAGSLGALVLKGERDRKKAEKGIDNEQKACRMGWLNGVIIPELFNKTIKIICVGTCGGLFSL